MQRNLPIMVQLGSFLYISKTSTNIKICPELSRSATVVPICTYATRPLSRCYLRSHLVKILQELTKSPARNTKPSRRASYEQCRTKQEYYTSITLKNLSYFHDLLTAELRDYADLIKFLNKSKNLTSFSQVLLKFN